MAPSASDVDSKGSDSKCNFEVLNFLLKAPSKEFVKIFLQDCFTHENATVAKGFADKTATALDISVEDAALLITSALELIKMAVFDSMSDPRDVFGMFPDEFHRNLRELLSKIIAECMPSWRSETISQQVSLPRLVDFDWRIDVKTGSSGRAALPSCLLQLKVDNGSLSGDVTREGGKNVNVELTKETLETMLDGLGKIRVQLSSVVSR